MRQIFLVARWLPACAGMTALLVVLCTTAFAATLTFPALTGRVVDDAHILRAETIQTLTGELAAHEQATGQQVVAVTLPSLQGQEIEDYGYQLGRAWGIGQKGKDTGALLIVAPKEHKARIEVGYGLEGQLTDAASANIVQAVMLPAFRTGDYDAGVTAGTEAILKILRGDTSDTQAARQYIATQSDNNQSPLMIFLVVAFIFYFFNRFARQRGSSGFAPLVLGSMLGGLGGGGSFGGGGGGGFGGGGASGSW